MQAAVATYCIVASFHGYLYAVMFNPHEVAIVVVTYICRHVMCPSRQLCMCVMLEPITLLSLQKSSLYVMLENLNYAW